MREDRSPKSDSKFQKLCKFPWWFFQWLGKYELSTLVILAVVAAGLWGFAELTDEVLEGSTHELDRQILLALRNPTEPADPLGPRWVQEIMRDVTALGGIAWLTALTLGTLGFLAMERKTAAMWLLAAAVTGGWLLSMGLKSLFDRPRPDLVPHASHVYSASFPSGHSMMAAVTYLTLAAVIARVHPQRSIKAYVITIAIFLTLLTGISRVYLGVHWPTDVLAGWTLGAIWAISCWLVARQMQRRGQMER